MGVFGVSEGLWGSLGVFGVFGGLWVSLRVFVGLRGLQWASEGLRGS